jgi:hypothetical protein
MRDSYETFFDHFNLKFQDIIHFGIELDTVFPDPVTIEAQWLNLIESIENNEVVYIRGYGRDAKGTYLYQELYRLLLNNKNIMKDSSNNAKPTQLLQNITHYSKTIQNDNETKERIINYQVSHIFGRTKNPFLFTAPWNIVWKSKLLDPFTGHESKGKNKDDYKKAFIGKAMKLYARYISDYNKLALKYFANDKLEKAFKQMETTIKEDDIIFNKFIKDARNELRTINQ